jgi:hypothetical protein
MSSDARREEALPGTALGGIAMSILTFLLRQRRSQVLEKPGPHARNSKQNRYEGTLGALMLSC